MWFLVVLIGIPQEGFIECFPFCRQKYRTAPITPFIRIFRGALDENYLKHRINFAVDTFFSSQNLEFTELTSQNSTKKK